MSHHAAMRDFYCVCTHSTSHSRIDDRAQFAGKRVSNFAPLDTALTTGKVDLRRMSQARDRRQTTLQKTDPNSRAFALFEIWHGDCSVYRASPVYTTSRSQRDLVQKREDKRPAAASGYGILHVRYSSAGPAGPTHLQIGCFRRDFGLQTDHSIALQEFHGWQGEITCVRGLMTALQH